MNYILLALFTAFFYALGILGEKYFIKHNGTVSEWTLVSLSTTTFMIASISLLPFTPISFSFSNKLLLLFIASGGLYAIAMILWFYAMNRESASKVGQLASLEAVMTPFFGIVFLHETPSKFTIIAIGVITLGLLLLVFDKGLARAILTTKFAVIPIFICLVLWASQDTVIKLALLQENFWTVFFWTRIISFFCFLPLLAKQTVRTDIHHLITTWRESKTYSLFSAKIATTVGLLLAVLTMSLGPLSVVSPVLASYPIFVFIIGSVVSRYTNISLEQTKTNHLAKRTTSIALFTLGIFLLYFL